MDDPRRKVLAGPQVRRLRAQLGLSQAAMAAELGISASYLNLVERNGRPLTAQLLIRLSETYAVDPGAFAQGADASAAADLDEVLRDPLLQPLAVPRAEARTALEEAPTLVAALRRLHAAYQNLLETGSAGERGEGPRAGDAVERVREAVQRAANHFPRLEEAAEGIAEALGTDGLMSAATARLRDRHRLTVEVLPVARLGTALRHHDRHRRKLLLSELLEPPGRAFALAYQLALMEADGAIDAQLAEAGLDDAGTRALGRVTLANYVAAAVLMPYAPFLAAAQGCLYDVDVLRARFGASWEQAAHRLTTLGRPGARGVPFFMLRLDGAGNVSKRFSAGAFAVSRQGGTCPRWRLHAALSAPGPVAQLVELPDGKRFATLARAVGRAARPWGEPPAAFVVALGCEERWAPQTCWGADLRGARATPIGVTCRLCERPACPSRAAPSLLAPLGVAEGTRSLSPFGT